MMQKASNGKFTRFYVTAFCRGISADKDIDCFLSDRQWVNEFNQASMFDESEMIFVEAWITDNKPEHMTVVVRKVDCQINGFDMGRFIK
jgi:hypothetical protein